MDDTTLRYEERKVKQLDMDYEIGYTAEMQKEQMRIYEEIQRQNQKKAYLSGLISNQITHQEEDSNDKSEK